ncbi:hypothetical protein OAO50_03270, partial [Paracoccaceae bacterium]|nr:hypothetical protein [Paracoccaceae bacterium]
MTDEHEHWWPSLVCHLLAELDLSNVPELRSLLCHSMSDLLTELDLSTVPELRKLGCSGNQLTELSLENVPK